MNKCKMCFKTFRSEKGLRDHIFHSKLIDKKHLEQKIRLREKRYVNAKKECHVCGKKIFRNTGLHLTRSKDIEHTEFYKKQSKFAIDLFKKHNSFDDISNVDSIFCREYPSKHFAKICEENLGKNKIMEISKKIFLEKRKKYWRSIDIKERKKIMEKARESEWGSLSSEERKNHPWVITGRKASLRSSKRGSKNQQYAFELLKQKFPDLDWKYNYVIGDSWHVDIASPEKSLYIEWDGRHHFVPIHGQKYLNNRKNRDKIKNDLVINKFSGCMIRIRDEGRENKKFVESKMNEIFKIIENKIPLKELIQL
ncbi:MAG: hypothetical protein CMH64_02625 [Nanoarchaeota archaeon]|nr:hypothetical protein [Nanoarchaeota archaeon]